MMRARVSGASLGLRAAVDATAARDEIPGLPERPRPRLLHPLVVGGILAVLCAPLGSTLPAAGLDPSWQLGLSLGAAHALPAGNGILFTYGPFGFVAAPNLVWLPGVLLGTAYALGAAWALYSLCYRAMLRWLPPSAAVAVVALVAIVAAAVRPVPEMVALASALWALEVVDARRLAVRMSPWVPAAFGAIAGMQLLVKFCVGVFGLGVAAVVTFARPRRASNTAAVAGGFVGTFSTLWLVLGEPLSALWPWLRGSFDAAAGYSPAMAVASDPSTANGWIVLVAAVAVVGFGGYMLATRQGLRALPSLVLLAGTTWFVVKEGFVRLDSGHAATTFLALAVLAVAIPWPRRWLAVGGAGAVLGLLGILVVGFTGSGTPLDGTQELARSLRATVDASYRSDRLVAARRELRVSYAIPPRVIAALEGHEVHADPWDIAAVWAYHLRWEPLPVFQTYFAYTRYLDDHNRDRLLASPRLAVLRHQDTSLDQRIPEWESPDVMLAATCTYHVAATGRGWEALTPGRNRCGAARALETVTVRPGQTVTVPTPRDLSSVVVARFDVPEGLLDRLTVVALKPRTIPGVVVDGRPARFVVGTAADAHVVAVPARVGDAVPANGGLDLHRIALNGFDGDVTVRFSEIPLR
jgi:hypothetical protein